MSGGVGEFVSVLTPTIILGAVVVIVFGWLRPKHPYVYKPRSKLQKDVEDLPQLPTSLFGWVSALLAIEERTLFEKSGVDAVVYTRVFKLSFQIFSVLCVIGCVVLIPTNLQGNNEESEGGLDDLTLSKIEQESDLLWVHTVVMWVFSLWCYYILKKNYMEILEYAREHNTKPKPHRYAILVTSIPEEFRSDEALTAYFQKLYPTEFHHATIGRDYSEVQKLFDEFQESRVNLMRARGKLESSDKNERPTHKHIPEDQPAAKCNGPLVCCCPCFSETVDTIEFWEQRVEKLQKEVEAERAQDHEPAPAGIVTFKTLSAATKAAQIRHSNSALAWNATVAPEPRDVFWANLPKDDRVKAATTNTVMVMTVVLVIFWTIPVAFVASISNLDALSDRAGWIETIVDVSPVLRSILQGFLPLVGLIVLMALLPIILREWAVRMGLPSTSEIDNDLMSRLMFFQVFHVFLIYTLSSSLFGSISDIIDSPSSIFELLGTSLPASSTFFVNYVVARALVEFPMELLRPGPLVVGNLLAKVAVTEQDRENAYAPGSVQYGKTYPGHTVVFVICISYAVIAPIILPVAVLFFGFGFIAWKHQFLYVYIPVYESGGRMWPQIFSFLIVGLYIAQFTILGVMALKKGFFQVICLFPLLIITYYFSSFFNGKYGVFLRSGFLPLEVAMEADSSHPATDDLLRDLVDAYVPPCMKEPLGDAGELEVSSGAGEEQKSVERSPLMDSRKVRTSSAIDTAASEEKEQKEVQEANGESTSADRA